MKEILFKSQTRSLNSAWNVHTEIMDGPSETPPSSNNPLTGYLQTLRRSKTSIPHGQLVCVSASPNITSTSALLRLAATVGPHIAVLQVHADIIDDWSGKTVRRLTYLAKVYGFLLWEGGRILNSQIGARGGVEFLSDEKIKRDVEMAKKRYTKGVVNVAGWAGLATSWIIPDESDGQRNGALIPTLRHAARETVASITRSVRTEITAGGDPDSVDQDDKDEEEEDDDDDDEVVENHESNNGSSEGLRPALPMRKESFIALTRTITQRSESSLSSRPSTAENGHDSPEHALNFEMIARPLRPPVLVRGLVLNLAPKFDTDYTTRYRRSCLNAARSNQDFVVGFLTDDSWLDPSKSENLLDSESDDDDDDDDDDSDSEDQEAGTSPLIFFSPLEIEHFGEVSQSIPSPTTTNSSNSGEPNRHSRNASDHVEQGTGAATPTPQINRDPSRNSDRGPDQSSLSARAISQAALLDRLVGRALEVKENNFALDSRRGRRRRRNPDILSIPVVTMTA